MFLNSQPGDGQLMGYESSLNDVLFDQTHIKIIAEP